MLGAAALSVRQPNLKQQFSPSFLSLILAIGNVPCNAFIKGSFCFPFSFLVLVSSYVLSFILVSVKTAQIEYQRDYFQSLR